MPFPYLQVCWRSLALLGSQTHHRSLCLCLHRTFSHVHVCVHISPSAQTQSYLIRAYLNHFIFRITSATTLKIRSHFQVLVLTSYTFLKEIIQPITVIFMLCEFFLNYKKPQTTKQFSSKRPKPWTRSGPGLPPLPAFLLFSHSLLSPADLVPVSTIYFYFFPHPLPFNSSEAFYPLGPSSKVTFIESACMTSWCKTASFIIYAIFDLVIYCCVAKHCKTS